MPFRSSIFTITAILHFSGAVVVFLIMGLFAAVHSPLGNAISPGESPVFGWIRDHMGFLFGFGLVYLVLTQWVQRIAFKSAQETCPSIIALAAALEGFSAFILTIFILAGWHVGVSLAFFVLLLAVLFQSVWGFQYQSDDADRNLVLPALQNKEIRAGLYLLLLFILGGIPAYLDPSWHRMQAYIWMDSQVDHFFNVWIPLLLSGTTAMWLGIIALMVLAGTRALQARIRIGSASEAVSFYLPFFLIAGFYTVIVGGTLGSTIFWEISELNLLPSMLALVMLVWTGASVLMARFFMKMLSCMPNKSGYSPVALVALSTGAVLLYPVLLLLKSIPADRWAWRIVLGVAPLLCGVVAFFVLYGGLFNPWFTALSYLKGAIVKVCAVVAAGALVLVIEELFRSMSLKDIKPSRLWPVIAIAFLLGLIPIGILANNPESKTAIIQFNELSRVDATYARELVNLLKLDRWIALGQRSAKNNHPLPWPQPWRLTKDRPSSLPPDFNLLVVIVDSLRGDAFYSNGYQHNLTPFLDSWAKQEAVSFRWAYSQGGGSFAAIPFLVAGRSHFELYGPDLHLENLYLKIARAEGIQHHMVMKGFGPRAIFPPDEPVIELTIPRKVSDRRSATADEVFTSARNAIGNIPAGERFLCFLHLMDVHNDLWKKADGIDFGDDPRAVYDNNLSYIDRAFSRFVNWLKKENIYDRTVIIFTADHGEQFWEHGASLHGHTLYEEEIRIPLILKVQGIRTRIENVPVIAADMAPTIAELAGYSVDPPYEDSHMGISLVPLIENNDTERYLKRDVVGRASFKRRYFFYRNWQWKLVYFADFDLLQLFNIGKDPVERKNLINEEPELAAELEKELFDYLERVEGKAYTIRGSSRF